MVNVRSTIVVATAALVAAACSSHYRPQPGRRIAVVLDGGQLAYQRDGEVYAHGVFGGGLVDAVSGVPAAEDAARTFRRRVAGGSLMLIGGFVCSFVALTVAFERSADDESEGPLAISGGCLVVGITGGVVMASGVPYQWDAINLYNDAVEPASPAPAPSTAPPGTWGTRR